MANKHVLYTFFLYRDLKDKIPRTFFGQANCHSGYKPPDVGS